MQPRDVIPVVHITLEYPKDQPPQVHVLGRGARGCTSDFVDKTGKTVCSGTD